MVGQTGITLSEFVAMVRQRMQDNGDGDVEELVAAILDENRGWTSLNLDRNEDTEDYVNRVFGILILSGNFHDLRILPSVTASHAEVMLRKAVTSMPELELVHIATSMTEREAESILSILSTRPTVRQIGIYLGICGDGIAKPLKNYLAESSSCSLLTLDWTAGENGRPPSCISEQARHSICRGIAESTSLEGLLVSNPPGDDHATAIAESLSRAVAKSSCMKEVGTYSANRVFTELLRTALLRTEAVQNFDLCFNFIEDDLLVVLGLNRNAPWKPILSENVPLALWPLVLSKTNVLNKKDSHSPMDVIYFLVKEKCDVLLQNVHRRRIRKRKRFQFT